MNLTAAQLRRIIKEEVNSLLNEQPEVGAEVEAPDPEGYLAKIDKEEKSEFTGGPAINLAFNAIMTSDLPAAITDAWFVFFEEARAQMPDIEEHWLEEAFDSALSMIRSRTALAREEDY
jgi:hypothetical protein|tara:strand:- start:23913 stop:24269 length:357 start_codon:yes stop_codon:yes gene_type:complete